MFNKMGDSIKDSIMQNNPNANLSMSERYVSLGTGAFITLKGVTNVFSHPWLAITELAVGGTLLYRGVTGQCMIKEKLENQADPIAPSAMPSEAY